MERAFMVEDRTRNLHVASKVSIESVAHGFVYRTLRPWHSVLMPSHGTVVIGFV